MLKWIKNMISPSKSALVTVSIAKDYSQVWYEMQTSIDELNAMDDNRLVMEVSQLCQSFASTAVLAILSEYRAELNPEDREYLENFYVFVNTELGVRCD
jgi:hypothetical protein